MKGVVKNRCRVIIQIWKKFRYGRRLRIDTHTHTHTHTHRDMHTHNLLGRKLLTCLAVALHLISQSCEVRVGKGGSEVTTWPSAAEHIERKDRVWLFGMSHKCHLTFLDYPQMNCSTSISVFVCVYTIMYKYSKTQSQ